MDPIALAVPFFLLFIAVEALYAWRKGLPYYRYSDTLANLGCAMVQQVADLFLKAAFLIPYGLVYGHLRLFTFPEGSLLVWCLAFFGVDLLYYWWHRASHRVNVMWAAHVVHHQSQDYNFAVALRQSAFGQTSSWLFYLPLAFLGVPPSLYLVHAGLSLVYQFWLHTRLVDRLPPFLEKVLNTPSHHRVHHGVNPRYIDRNYGAILIVWDRVFGTFVEETETPVYGTVSPFRSWNPVWANLENWVDLAKRSIRMERWPDRLSLWFRPPEWLPGGKQVEIPAVDARSFVKWDTAIGAATRWSAATAFTAALVASLFILYGGLTTAGAFLMAAVVVACGIGYGLLLNRPGAAAGAP